MTPASAADYPLTPPHLDWSLVWIAAANYYAAHPEKETFPGESGGPTVSAQALEARSMAILSEPKPPKGHESNDRREWVLQRE